MEHITTYTGKNFKPLAPDTDLINIEDIAHALSLMCRANGHIVRFFSVAQHSINCANEAVARGYSRNVQLACLLHDASEAYLSDLTRPVKEHFPNYLTVEKRLQAVIYDKYLERPLSDDEQGLVKQVDDDMLVYELDALLEKKLFDELPPIRSKPSFKFTGFLEIEKEFKRRYNEITGLKAPAIPELGKRIAIIEKSLYNARGDEVLDCLNEHDITSAAFSEKLFVKESSAQVDTYIHAYGILLALSKIQFDPDERILELSLGAGVGKKPFDVMTTKRLAEFKFAKWTRSRNAIRQNNIFLNFLELAIYPDSSKTKYLYCFSADAVIKFLSCSGRNLKSVLSRNTMHKKYEDIQDKYDTVKDFYARYKGYYKTDVKIVELSRLLGLGD